APAIPRSKGSRAARPAVYSERAYEERGGSALRPYEWGHPSPDLAAGRPAGARSVRVRRLAGRGRPELVAGPPARASRRVRLAVHVVVRVRLLEWSARGSRGEGRAVRARAVPRAARLLDRRLGALRRRGRRRRPAPVRAGMARAACPCALARGSADRGPPDVRRGRQRRRRRPSAAVRSRAPRGGGARRVAPERAALGPAGVPVAHAAHAALLVVDRALSPLVRARRPPPHRPLPRLRVVLGDSGGEHRSARRRLAPRAGPPSLP